VGPWAGLDGCGKSHPTGIRSPDRQARSESLYRLRYPGPQLRLQTHLEYVILIAFPRQQWLREFPNMAGVFLPFFVMRRLCVTIHSDSHCGHSCLFLLSPSLIFHCRCKIKKNKMGGACDTYGGEEICTRFWWGSLSERDCLEGLGEDGIILKWIFKK
jgi:hypothetical protein